MNKTEIFFHRQIDPLHEHFTYHVDVFERFCPIIVVKSYMEVISDNFFFIST